MQCGVEQFESNCECVQQPTSSVKVVFEVKHTVWLGPTGQGGVQ